MSTWEKHYTGISIWEWNQPKSWPLRLHLQLYAQRDTKTGELSLLRIGGYHWSLGWFRNYNTRYCAFTSALSIGVSTEAKTGVTYHRNGACGSGEEFSGMRLQFKRLFVKLPTPNFLIKRQERLRVADWEEEARQYEAMCEAQGWANDSDYGGL